MELIATAVAHAAAEPQRVWDRLVNGLRWCEWSPATDWMVAEGPLRAGQIVTIKRKRGRQTAYHVDVAEEPRRLAFVLTFGPLASLRLAWTLEPENGGTAIRQTVETGGPLRRWFTEGQARRGAQAWADDPKRLADLVGTS